MRNDDRDGQHSDVGIMPFGKYVPLSNTFAWVNGIASSMSIGWSSIMKTTTFGAGDAECAGRGLSTPTDASAATTNRTTAAAATRVSLGTPRDALRRPIGHPPFGSRTAGTANGTRSPR